MNPSIPRHLLPQIPKDKLPEFEKYLSNNGVECQQETVPVDSLKPTQSHFNQSKIDKIIENPPTNPPPLLVTTAGDIIDGHHRWMSAKQLGDSTIDVLRCSSSLPNMLKLAHNFDHSYVKSIHELTTYSISISSFNKTNFIRQCIREEIKQFFQEDDEEDLTYDDGSGERLKYSNQDGVSGGMGTMMS